METAKRAYNGHSADVRIDLCLNGQVLPISHLGPNFFILSKSIDHPPTHAEIDLSIDDYQTRWSVYLPEGISPNREKTTIAPRAAENGSPVG